MNRPFAHPLPEDEISVSEPFEAGRLEEINRLLEEAQADVAAGRVAPLEPLAELLAAARAAAQPG